MYERLDVDVRRVAQKGWPRHIQRVRLELPATLHDSPPSALALRGSWVVIATRGGETVGFAWAVHAAGDAHGAYIEEVAVSKSARHGGVGGGLVREIARWMLELDRTYLTMYPVTGSGWALRAGFQPIEGSNTYEADARDVLSISDAR